MSVSMEVDQRHEETADIGDVKREVALKPPVYNAILPSPFSVPDQIADVWGTEREGEVFTPRNAPVSHSNP